MLHAMQSPERANTFCLHKEPHHCLSMEQKTDKETELTLGFTIEKTEKKGSVLSSTNPS